MSDITICPCGIDVDPEKIPSFSVVKWDGHTNVLVQMYCIEHEPGITEPEHFRSNDV